MNISFEYHPESLLILPLLAVTQGECDDPDCESEHWQISMGWIVWNLEICFEL